MLLNVDIYLISAIALIAFIVIVFIVTFVINRKTPVPKGCENIKIEESTCLACNNKDCQIHKDFDYKKLEDELKEEMKK